jgi:hypothetical protein
MMGFASRTKIFCARKIRKEQDMKAALIAFLLLIAHPFIFAEQFSVDTVRDLLALDAKELGASAAVKGYYSIADGGGGIFYFFRSIDDMPAEKKGFMTIPVIGRKYLDEFPEGDGGMFLKGARGWWIRDPAGAGSWLNVEWFGAVANDDMPDDKIISKILQLVDCSKTWGDVYFPAGQYLIKEPIVVPYEIKTKLRGEGEIENASQLRCAPNISIIDMKDSGSGKNFCISFENLRFEGSGKGDSGVVVHSGSVYTRFIGCDFRNFSDYGINFLSNNWACSIINCHFTSIGKIALNIGPSSVFEVQRCIFETNAGTAVKISPGANNVLIQSCHFEDNAYAYAESSKGMKDFDIYRDIVSRGEATTVQNCSFNFVRNSKDPNYAQLAFFGQQAFICNLTGTASGLIGPRIYVAPSGGATIVNCRTFDVWKSNKANILHLKSGVPQFIADEDARIDIGKKTYR